MFLVSIGVTDRHLRSATTMGHRISRYVSRVESDEAKDNTTDLLPSLGCEVYIIMAAAVAGGTPLQTSFVFSYMRRGGKGKAAGEEGEQQAAEGQQTQVVHPYENSIKTISTVSTVESFWATYDFLKVRWIQELQLWDEIQSPFSLHSSGTHFPTSVPVICQLPPIITFFAAVSNQRGKTRITPRVASGLFAYQKDCPVDIGRK